MPGLSRRLAVPGLDQATANTLYAAKAATEAAIARTDPGSMPTTGQYLGYDASGPVPVDEPRANVRHPRWGAVGDGTADDAPAINAALAAVDVVYIPAGRYRCDSGVRVPGDTALLMDPDTVLVRNFTGGGALLANSDRSTAAGQEGIVIRGGVLDSAIGSSYTGNALVLKGVAKCAVYDTRIIEWNGAWATEFNGDDLLIDGMMITTDDVSTLYKDGIHITGGSRIAVSNCVIRCYDDAVSVSKNSNAAAFTNDLTDITISNITALSNRIIKVNINAGDTHSIKRVVITNITGHSYRSLAGSPIAILNETTQDQVSDIDISHVYIDGTGSTYGVQVDNSTNVRMSHVVVPDTENTTFDIENCADVRLHSCESRNVSASGGRAFLALNSSDVELYACVARNASQHSIYFNGVTRGKVQGCTSTGAVNNGLRLNDTTGVLVTVNQLADNTGLGIEEAGTSDYNIFDHNDLRGNGGGAISTVGVNSVIGTNMS